MENKDLLDRDGEREGDGKGKGERRGGGREKEARLGPETSEI